MTDPEHAPRTADGGGTGGVVRSVDPDGVLVVELDDDEHTLVRVRPGAAEVGQGWPPELERKTGDTAHA